MEPAGVEAGPGLAVLVQDDFGDARPPGQVVGTRCSSGARRLGADCERSLSVDHGQLRMGWMAHPGWGKASIAYGPFSEPEGLVLEVRALNGLNCSQSDPRPEGRRAKLRRWAATFPGGPLRRPRLQESMVIGWFTDAVPSGDASPVAAVVHRAGADANGELWFRVGSQEVRLARVLQNLPATYVLVLEGGAATLFAWSYPGAHGFGDPHDRVALARLELENPRPPRVYAGVHQVVLGEVDYRVDTRVEQVRVLRWSGPGPFDGRILGDSALWEPASGPEAITDDFSGSPGDLRGSATSDEGPGWERVLGEGVLERTGAGSARVRATIAEPNPGRTVYCVPWDDPLGVEVSVVVTPPGSDRGEAHRGRGGLTVWQDADNHLVVNNFVDDVSLGVSISAFLRTGGEETMHRWDAVWTNVGHRVHWGRSARLTVSCDGTQFLCRVDGEPVLYRSLTDYRADARPLQIQGVGLVANWEWGDDTGSHFEDFCARRLGSAPSKG